jgi:hypothetical protein
MMVLTRREAVVPLIENMTAQYYAFQDKPPAILLCKPIAGSRVLMMNGR